MAASEWTRSVRAVRDIPVAVYSAPSVNTTRRVAYRPLTAVSSRSVGLLFLTNTLALWPTVTIRRNGFIGYTVASSLQCNGRRCEILSSRLFYITLEKRRKVRRYDTTRPWGSTQLCGSTKSRKEQVRRIVGKHRVCIFVVWQDEMKMKCCLSTPGSPEYILQVGHSTSITPVSPFTHHHSLTIYLEAVIELVWRCTWRPRSSELRVALGGRDQSSLQMHWEAVIERV